MRKHKHIKDQRLNTREYLEYNLNKLKRTRYTNLMWGNESVNKMTNKNAMFSLYIQCSVQMYRVNKSNNDKRCTWTSDENHCAPEQPTFQTDLNCSSSRTNNKNKTTTWLTSNCKACKSTEKCNGF